MTFLHQQCTRELSHSTLPYLFPFFSCLLSSLGVPFCFSLGYLVSGLLFTYLDHLTICRALSCRSPSLTDTCSPPDDSPTDTASLMLHTRMLAHFLCTTAGRTISDWQSRRREGEFQVVGLKRQELKFLSHDGTEPCTHVCDTECMCLCSPRWIQHYIWVGWHISWWCLPWLFNLISMLVETLSNINKCLWCAWYPFRYDMFFSVLNLSLYVGRSGCQ